MSKSGAVRKRGAERAGAKRRERASEGESEGVVVLSGVAFARLAKELRGVIEEGKARAEAAVGRELVRTYHELGWRIGKAGLSRRAGYGKAVMQQLAEELEMDVRVLQRAVAFARLYPQLPAGAGRLRWAHYRELSQLKSAERRAWYEQQAAERGWTRARLVEAIRSDAFGKGSAENKKVARGKRKLERPREATYVYKATVDRVIDGDTLLLLIDLGFEVMKRQRVRLAGLDAPGPKEAGGEEAYAFVRDALAAVDFVMVKTNKIDLHGRYVGHLFYAPGEADKLRVFARGRYLNQELVSEGLAAAL